MTAITQAGLSGVLYVSDTRYVAHQQGVTNQEAKNQLKLSRFLASNTLSAKAVLNNDIGLGHADALARAWSAHPDGSAVGLFRFAADDAEILLGAIATVPDPAGSLTPPRSLGQRQADALIEALTDTDSDVETPGGSGVKIDVTIDIQTLAGIVDGADKEWTLEDLRSSLGRTGDLPPAVIEKLMCDASFRRIVFVGPWLCWPTTGRPPKSRPHSGEQSS